MARSKRELQELERQRVVQVYHLLLRGLRRVEIIGFIQDPENADETPAWLRRNQKTIDKAIAEATDMVLDRVDIDPEQELAASISELDDMYREARKDGNLSTALRIRKEKNAVLQLKYKFAVIEQNVTHQDAQMVPWDQVVDTVAAIRGMVCEDCQPLLDEILQNAQAAAE